MATDKNKYLVTYDVVHTSKKKFRKTETTHAWSALGAKQNIILREKWTNLDFLRIIEIPKSYFTYDEIREGTKTVTVDGKQRRVSIEKDRGSIRGKVGDVHYVWSPKYKYPMMPNEDGDREVIRKYVLTMVQSPMTSPIHKEAYEGDGGGSASSGRKILPGLPEWLREVGKVWTACYWKNGEFAYFRRTRYSEEGAELAKLALPTCQHCANRGDCDKPCEIIAEILRANGKDVA